MGRHTGRRRDVSTIITASVTWFASFVTRSNWSHIEDRFNVSSSAPEISDDCGDNLPFQTALNSAKSNEINLLNQRFTFSENYPQWSPAAAKVFFHSSISCGKESSSSSILIQLRFFGCMWYRFLWRWPTQSVGTFLSWTLSIFKQFFNDSGCFF